MMDEQFARGESFLHRRNARVKIIGAFLFTLVVALTHHFSVAFSALTLALLLLLVGRLPLVSVVKRLLLVNTFTLFLWLTLPLTYGGENITQWGPLQFSGDGMRLAFLITVKTNAIITTLMALISTSTVANIGHGLERLGVPERLCFLLLFSYRFIFVIHQEYMRLLRAAKIRNFLPATNLHTYKTYGYLFGMTLVKSRNRSQRVHQAMILRGFDGKLIPLGNHTLEKKDYIFLIGLVMCISGLVFIGFCEIPYTASL